MRTSRSPFLFWPRAAALAGFFLLFPGLVEQFEVPKAAAIIVLGAGALGVLLGSPKALRALRLTGLDVAALTALLVEFASAAAAEAPRFSFFGNPAQRYGFITSLALAGLYMAARIGTRTSADAWATLRVVFIAGVTVAFYALTQAFGLDPIPWARTSAFGSLAMRPFGTFGHPNLLGIVSCATGASALAATLALSSRRFLPALTAIVCGAATLLTLSRGAWLGAAVGCLAALVLTLMGTRPKKIDRARLRTRSASLVLGVAVIAIACYWASPWGALLRERAAELISLQSGSGRPRLEIWRIALRAWAAHPWLGNGPDSFGLVFPRFQTPEYWRFEWGGIAQHAHSIYFNTLAERGLMGTTAGVGAVVAAAAALRSAWRRGGDARTLAAIFAAGMLALAVSGAFGTLGIGGSLLLVLFGALLASLSREEPEERKPSEREGGAARHNAASADPSWALSHAALLAGACLSMVALVSTGVTLRASFLDRSGQGLAALADRSRGAAKKSALSDAVNSFARAGTWAPSDDEILRHHASALVRSATFSDEPRPLLVEAEIQARRAIQVLPLRAANHVCLGEVLLTQARLGNRGRVTEGEAAFARAIELAPADATILATLARWELDLGRPRLALEPAERALALYPDEAEPLYQRGRALHGLGEREQALGALERAAQADWRGDKVGQRDATRLWEALRHAPAATSASAREGR